MWRTIVVGSTLGCMRGGPDEYLPQVSVRPGIVKSTRLSACSASTRTGRVALRLRRQHDAEQCAFRIMIARLVGEAHVRASVRRGDVLDHVLRDFRPLALDKHFIVILDHA